MTERSAVLLDAGEIAPAIDRAHLRAMTLDDARLEREVLQLFDRQAANFVARMQHAAPDAIYAMAHALKGSARGIGAFAIAHAAEAVEQAARKNEICAAALGTLAAAVARTRVAIAQVLQA